MFAIVVNELKKPFFYRFFRWFLIFILIGNIILCVPLLASQINYIDYQSNQQTPEYYTERLNSICAEAELNKLRLIKLNVTENDFAYRYQDEFVDKYSHLQQVVEINPDYSAKGWTSYFRYSYSNIFAVLGSLLLVCSVMVYDRTIGMWNIMRTTGRGRGCVYIGKCLSVFILSFAFTLVCKLSVFGIVWYSQGLSSPWADLQNIPEFFLSAYEGSILSFFVFTLIQQCFIIAVYSCVVGAIAALSGRYFIPIASGAAIYGIGYILYTVSPTSSWRYLNFYESLNPTTFFDRYEAINVFGRPVSVLTVCIISALILLCISFILIFIGLAEPLKKSVNKITVLKKIKLPACFYERKYEKCSLLSHELYKIFTPRVGLLLLFCLILHVYTDIVLFKHKESYQEQALKEYTDILKGMEEDEQEQYIISELEYLGSIVNAETEMTDKYFSGKITTDEFSSYNRSLNEAKSKITPLVTLQSRVYYLKNTYEEKNIKGQLIFDYPIEKLISGTSCVGLYIGIVFLACTAAAVDYQKKESAICFCDILSTTRYGRRNTLRLKLAIVCAAVSLIVVLLSVIDLSFCIHSTDVAKLSVPIISFPDFSTTDSGIPIYLWYFIEIISKVIFACALGIFSFCIVIFVKNTLFSYIIIMIATLLPGLLSKMGVTFLTYADAVMTLSSPQLYQLSAQTKYFDYILVLFYIMMMCGAVSLCVRKCFRNCENNT